MVRQIFLMMCVENLQWKKINFFIRKQFIYYQNRYSGIWTKLQFFQLISMYSAGPLRITLTNEWYLMTQSYHERSLYDNQAGLCMNLAEPYTSASENLVNAWTNVNRIKRLTG